MARHIKGRHLPFAVHYDGNNQLHATAARMHDATDEVPPAKEPAEHEDLIPIAPTPSAPPPPESSASPSSK